MTTFNPEDHMLFECVTGSTLYGMATPESDVDVRGVCLPPMRAMLDPFESFRVKDGYEGEDKAVYALAEFMKLCADNNPNLLELLFVPAQFTLRTSPQWKMLLEHRHLFLSKNVKHRFLGYAFAQMKAIERHREWFINPPAHKPAREEFGLTQTPLVSEASLQNVMAVSAELFRPEVHDELVRERAYREAKKQWDNYQQWQKNRNPKRKGTEEKFGYDTKYASHLFRLMEEGRQLLLTGEVVFPLENASWLLAVKNGVLSYEEVLENTSEMERNFERWYAESSLPLKPDRNALKELYFELAGV